MAVVMRQVSCGRAMLLLLSVWVGFLLLTVSLMRHDHPADSQADERLSQALRDLQSLHHQRQQINQLIYEFSSGGSALKQEEKAEMLRNIENKVKDHLGGDEPDEDDPSFGPPTKYEKLRRRIKMGADEMWNFLSSELKKVRKDLSTSNPALAEKIDKVLNLGSEHKRSLSSDIDRVPEVDGYNSWRIEEAKDLSDLVQRRIKYLQNPENCSDARKLVCNLNKGCGYGCQLHHAVYCLLVAYGTERTLILKSQGWRYSRSGWERVFKPISETCTDPSGTSTANWPGKSNSQVVTLGIIDTVVPRPAYLPLAVPADLAPRIARLHGDPSVWWVGQFLKYLLRPQPDTDAMLNSATLKLGFKGPVVGVHIRRTDKVGTEAAFHSVDEYMVEVEEYFKKLMLSKKIDKKRIYLATDDPKAFKEVQTKYPDYEVYGDAQVAKLAAVATRYTDDSLNGIIRDIYFLSVSDFLVCTLSSQVCRVAYEIMQTLHPDASARFRSLDDIYYYGGQGIHKQLVLMDHKPDSLSGEQVELKAGDMVGVAGNHWNGFSKGRNLRTNFIGLYPSFKVENVVEAVKFPTYSAVPIKKPKF